MSKPPDFYRAFAQSHPDVAAAYEGLASACRAAGPLDSRTVALVKLSIAIGAGTEGSTHSHARRALAAEISPAELEHVALLAITTLGFPRAMAGLAWIRDVTGKPGPRVRRRVTSSTRARRTSRP